eukprot:scaffold2957_cov232-Chaetoceros_neogracile.AAC.10
MPDAFFCQEERSLDNYEDNNTQHTKSANHFLKHIIARECDYRLCSAICIKEEVEGKPLTIDDSPNLSSCTL